MKGLFTLIVALAFASPCSAEAIGISGEKLAECKGQTNEAECTFNVFADYVASGEFAAVCATDEPTNQVACLQYSVQFLCLGFDLAKLSSPERAQALAVRGRGASLAMFQKGPIEPTNELLVLVNAPWDLLQGEACQAMGDTECLMRMQDRVQVANSVGAYQKYGLKQCFRETGGIPQVRVAELLAAREADLQ